MMTQAEQIQTLLEDISRAEKAGLVTRGSGYTIEGRHVGEFSVVVPEVTSGALLIELVDYLRQSYPDVCFRYYSRRAVYYNI